MASSNKKAQTGVRQSTVTLHNFFSSGLGKTEASKVPQTRQHTSETAASTVRPEDIIVIDSDDDDEIEVIRVVTTKKKRRRSSESSGEVQFVDRSNAKRPILDTSSAGLKGKGVQPQLASTASHPISVQGPCFGEPSELLCPRASSSITDAEGQPSVPLTIGKSLVRATSSLDTVPFGSPTSLLGFQGGPRLSRLRNGSPSAPLVLGSQTLAEIASTNPDLRTDYDDEWGTGDDETAFIQAAEAGDNLEDGSFDRTTPVAPASDSVVGDTLQECPVCGSSLGNLPASEFQAHINRCPGLVSTLPALMSEPSFSGTLRPLSSLPVPPIHDPQQLMGCDGRTRSTNAFSVLMSSHKEEEAWKEAVVAEDRIFRPTKDNGGRRKAPFYKVLQGMPIAVDAFRYGTIPGVTAYFLTHAHSDHYTNLSSTWKNGPIYCSQGTANLIIHMLSVDRKWVHPLPMDVPTIIPNTGNVRVTLIEANHCPGSCLFLYEGPQTVNAGDTAFKSSFVGSPKIFRYLHCGDFRASPRHVLHPAIKGKKIDHVYLDTTYLDPKYTFPPQPLVISACAELAKRIVSGRSIDEKTGTVDSWMTSSKGDTVKHRSRADRLLFVVGTYSIGKERIVKAIAHALNTKVYCDARKTAILRCQADQELNDLLTSNPLEASVHLVPLGVIASDKLKTYVERFKGNFSRAVGFRPTGWTYTQPTGTDQTPSVSSILSRSQHQSFAYSDLRPARNSTPQLQLFPVPYSEHSSFFELTCFAMSFEWVKMIATVNVGSENSRGKMAKWVAKWEAERKKRGKDVIVPHKQPDYW